MATAEKTHNGLLFRGSKYIRQILLLSTLSGRRIHIKDIRSSDHEPGLKEFEINLIRLLDKITNGTCVELNETGTSLSFQPGLLYGGTLSHECCTQRGIGYYLEVLVALGPFCKKPLNITLKGITNSNDAPSVDHIRDTFLPALLKFIVVDDGLSIKIKKRGMMPKGGGEVIFTCPIKNKLRPVQCLDPGMVKRIRGTVYAARVSPAFANRMVEHAKSVLLKFLPDVYINTDHCKGPQGGLSPGFGVCLVAETTNDIFYAAECVSKATGEDTEPTVPEDIGEEVAHRLIDEIYRGGCVDSTAQSLVALCMVLGPKDISKYVTGPFSDYTIGFLRHLKEFFGVTFKLTNPQQDQEDDDDAIGGCDKVLMTCVGIGYTNLSKRYN